MTGEERYWLWLSGVEGIGVKSFYRLLAEFGSAEAVFQNAREARSIDERAKKNLLEARGEERIDGMLNALARTRTRAIARPSADYPAPLEGIYDPPPVLYCRGEAEIVSERMFAIVGSRRATREGRRTAEEFAAALAAQDVCLVSGMARGVDSYAHAGALGAGGRSVAVLGCGPDVVYPPENAELFAKLLDLGGTILSEYPPGAPPLAAHFPPRNRVISGLCAGVLLVEGDIHSGAMITIDFALEQGRDVFATPGSIYAPLSNAPNKCIAEGAIPALTPWDILEHYRWAARPTAVKAKSPPALDAEEAKIWNLARNELVSFDELAAGTGFSAQKLNSLLTRLELRGIIKQAPGKQYRVT